MKKTLLLIAVLVVGSVASFAADCTTGTLAYFIGLGSTGCTIGDKTFYNFTFTGTAGGGATALTSADVTVNPLTSGDLGVLFNFALGAGPGQTNDVFVSFDVAVSSGPALIKDASLVQTGSIAGTGFGTIGENVCPTDTTSQCTGTVSHLDTFDANGLVQLSDNTVFSPTGTIHATKDAFVTGGTAGLASISGMEDRFSQTIPEPASLSLMGAALLGLAAMIRRKKIV